MIKKLSRGIRVEYATSTNCGFCFHARSVDRFGGKWGVASFTTILGLIVKSLFADRCHSLFLNLLQSSYMLFYKEPSSKSSSKSFLFLDLQ